MENLYDVVIVGGGPAGLTAAIYLARARFRVLVLEKERFGGQIAITDEVVNYPGIAKTDGKTLTETMRRQAERFGAEFQMAEATALDFSETVKTVRTTRGEVRCFGVLLATGAQPKPVGFVGEEEYRGRGVAYCATCDGEFFTGKDIFAVGGGYAAAEESIFLTRFARSVTILIRGDDFSCAASVAQRARENEKITVLTNTVLEEVSGENGLNYLRWRNTATGEVTEQRREAGEEFGVFVFAGYAPQTALARGLAQLDEQGYVRADASGKTSTEGLYAAGDVCRKPLRQVVTATADGALAATALEKYVQELRAKTGLRAPEPEVREFSEEAPEEATEEVEGELFSSQMRQELAALFAKLERPLVLKLHLDESPLSRELAQFLSALAELSDKLTLREETQTSGEELPFVRVCLANGTDTGLAFHGVPGGHEFTSFVLGLYNAAGPGQSLSEETKRRIAAIDQPTALQIFVTLSCTLCPDVVIAAQRIAAENPKISAHVYDIRHFEALKERYGVMSVPCLVLGGEKVSFGKKTLEQILDLIEQ